MIKVISEQSMYDVSKLMKAFKEIRTTSGPVKPATSAVISTMKSFVTPVRGNPTKLDWEKEAERMNGSLLSKRNYLDITKITEKAVTESVSSTPASALRLDLHSIAMDGVHSKFSLTRKGYPVDVELMYPNADGKMSVRVTADGTEYSCYDIDVNSPQFTDNFGLSIIKSVDEVLKKKSENGDGTADMYEFGLGQTAGGSGPGYSQTGFGLGESVNVCKCKAPSDGYSLHPDLYALRDLCQAVVEADDAAPAPGADAFAAPAGGSPAPSPDPSAASAVNAGPDSSDAQGSDDEPREDFKSWAKDHVTTSLGGTLDKIAKIVSGCMSEDLKNSTKGIVYGSEELYNGTQGLKNEDFDSIIDAFLTYYDKFAGEQKVSDMEKLCDYIDNHDSDLHSFNSFVAGAFPDKYGIQAQSANTDALNLPDDPFGTNPIDQSLPQPSPEPQSAPSGDYMNTGIGGMMDQANGMSGGDLGGAPAPEGGAPAAGEESPVPEEGTNPEEYPNI